MAKLKAYVIAEKIGIPAEEWASRCYEISCAILRAKLIRGRPCYGLYLGPIAPTTYFAGQPLVRHGWIGTKDFVIDPTRWVFEGLPPYIYVGVWNDEYDLGATKLRQLTKKPYPADDEAGPWYKVKLSKRVLTALPGPVKINRLTRRQLHWIATLPPKDLGPLAKQVYQAVVNAGGRLMVPVDFRVFYLGGEAGGLEGLMLV